ncbi:hypothetical protein JCM9533A_85260 [Catenuloplanes niger JCM 9533]
MPVATDHRPRVGAPITDDREPATVEALRRMHRPGCPPRERERLREEVLRRNLSLAHRLAARYRDRGEHLDDLRQVAALALVKAVDGYDPGRGGNFTAYAHPTITGELKRHFRDRVWSVHLPRQVQERSLDVTRARAELTQRLQHTPSASEIATVLGVTEADVRATDASASAYRCESLNHRSGSDDAPERLDLLGDRDSALDAVSDRVALETTLAELPVRVRHVVRRYFFDNRTQDQIASELGTSQMTVSRLLAGALARLRTLLSDDAEVLSATPAEEPLRTCETEPGVLVATVTGHAVWRDALIGLVVSRRPRTLVVDLRRLRCPAAGIARALIDLYRASGHTGSGLRVVNLTPQQHAALRAYGVTRLVACQVRTPAVPPRPAQPSDGYGDDRPTRPFRPSAAPAGSDRPAARPTARTPAPPAVGDAEGRRRCFASVRPGQATRTAEPELPVPPTRLRLRPCPAAVSARGKTASRADTAGPTLVRGSCAGPGLLGRGRDRIRAVAGIRMLPPGDGRWATPVVTPGTSQPGRMGASPVPSRRKEEDRCGRESAAAQPRARSPSCWSPAVTRRRCCRAAPTGPTGGPATCCCAEYGCRARTVTGSRRAGTPRCGCA